MCPPGYHHSGFVATVHHVPTEHELSQSYCDDNRMGTLFHDCIYVMPILLW